MNGHARTQRGFTLIEVLVALAIAGVALAACVRALGMGVHSTQRLEERLLALQAAENQLAQMHLERAFPQPGKQTLACAQGALKLRCDVEVKASDNRNFRQVILRVRQENGPVLAQLGGVLSTLP